MAKSKKTDRLNPQETEYLLKYGGLPNDKGALLQVAREKYPFTQRSFDKAMERLSNLSWETVEFVMYLVPLPSPRPRLGGGHFYVKGAAGNKKLITKFIKRQILFTNCEIAMEAYLPTPVSVMTHAEIYLAEDQKILPVGSCDVDNLMKTYMDMITGHLLLNDNIVTVGHLEKFYSLKPRMVVRIRYQSGFDSHYNEKRIERSKAYKDEFNPA